MIKKIAAIIIALSFAGATPDYPNNYDELASSEEVKKKKKKKGFFSKVFGSK